MGAGALEAGGATTRTEVKSPDRMSACSACATIWVRRMTFAALVPSASSAARRAPRLAIRSLLILCAAMSLASCSMFDDFNPFGAEKYKMVIEPDVPASKVYDQGLAKLADGAPADAAKKFTDLGAKFPDSDWARKGLLMTTYAQFTAADYDSAAQSAERYVKL